VVCGDLRREWNMPLITIQDQTISGKSTNELTVDILTERITVRELIRLRVYQEVQDFNRRRQAGPGHHFRGLVQPTDAEASINGYKVRSSTPIDWKAQFEKACDAFGRNGILILVDNHQPTELDEPITLTAKSTVSFVRLVPLVGG
jgi:hypothetical protein